MKDDQKLIYSNFKQGKIRNRAEAHLVDFIKSSIQKFDTIEEFRNSVLEEQNQLSSKLGRVTITKLQLLGRVVNSNLVTRSFSIFGPGRKTYSLMVWERGCVPVKSLETLERCEK